jgi:hypothetical protein
LTVEDKIAPVVHTKQTVQLAAYCFDSLPDVKCGSTDACGIATMTLTRPILLCYCWSKYRYIRVTDVNGNIATGTAIVTVEDKLRQ